MNSQITFVQIWGAFWKAFLEIINCHISIYFVTGLLLTGCFPTEVKTPATTSSNNKHLMVRGKIEFSESYCGGAPPPEEMVQELEKKKPLVGYKLYIRAGRTNDIKAPIIDSFSTNEDGEFEFNLLPGEYILLSSNHITRDVFTKYQEEKFIKIANMDCLENWWQNGMTKLILENQPIDNIYFHLKKNCFLPLGIPCLKFNGPIPP